MSERRKKTRLKLHVASLQGDGYHIFVEANIDHIKLRLLIDTGASRTVIDKTFLSRHFNNLKTIIADDKATGLGSNTIISEVATLPELNLGHLQLKNYMVAVLDLSHVNETYKKIGLGDIAGVIGSDIFYAHKGIINYDKKTLILNV